MKNRFDVPLKIKSINEKGEFEGYGSVFGVKDSHSDIVVAGAFQKSLARWNEKGQLPALLWMHKLDEPIGIYTEIKEDENGLLIKGRLLIDDDPLAKRAYAHMKAGSITGFSIGYELIDYEWDRDKQAFILKEIDLWEISLVLFPSNDESRLIDVKTTLLRGDTPQPKIVEKHLRDVGFSRQQAKAFMAKGFSGLNQRDVDHELIEKLNNLTKQMEA